MSRSRLAPLGVAALAVITCVAAFPIGNALLDSPDPDGAQLQAAAAPGADDPTGTGAGRLTTATSCANLLDTLISESEDLIGPWGWEYRYGWANQGYYTELVSDTGISSRTVSKGPTPEQSSSETGTNVQETGVDEPDVAKTDGDILARIDRRTITLFDLGSPTQPGPPEKVATLTLPRSLSGAGELLLAGDRLIVLGSTWSRANIHTTMISVDVSDPARPTIVDTRRLDGELLSARLTGDGVRLVTSTGLPDLDFARPGKGLTRKQAKARNRELLAASRIEQWLPQLRVDGATSNLLDCGQIEVPEEIESLGFLNVIGFAADDPADYRATSVLTQSRIVYTSTDRLYLATGTGWCCDVMLDREPLLGRGAQANTVLHAFALDGVEASYLASGEVDGGIADRWAMDSADGVLRVAVSTSLKRGTGRARREVASHSVITLGERGGELVELGSVDGLGVNEAIQSVRWFDDIAYLVTFRQVDPLYAIDLGDPEDPTLLGELKIPGFSSYLHPIGNQQLLGLGTDATLRGRTRGAQAAIFDVSDPTRLRQASKRSYPRATDFGVSWEPREFTWLPQLRTALTPLTEWSRSAAASIVVLQVGEDGALTSRRIPVEGWRGGSIRTLPLPDGRVVLTYQRRAVFLEW